MPMQGGLSVERIANWRGAAARDFIDRCRKRAVGEEDVEVQSMIQLMALEHGVATASLE